MDPVEKPQAERPRGWIERSRRYAALSKERAERAKAWAHEEQARHASVDAAFEMADRDGEVGGGIIAGALAYRLFLWLLALALVAVAGLGIASSAASESPREAAGSLGLGGLVANSIAGAADSSKRWYALLVGIPLLVWVTRSTLRVLIGAHRLVWTEVRARAPKPTLIASLRLLGLLLSFWIVSGAASAVRARSQGFGVLVMLALTVVYAGLWLVVALRLPHRDAPWYWLVPGAILLGLGLEVMHVFTVYFLVPYAISKQGTYGALGGAVALLFGLYILSRLIVGSAVVNATLWDRHMRGASPVRDWRDGPAGEAAQSTRRLPN